MRILNGLLALILLCLFAAGVVEAWIFFPNLWSTGIVWRLVAGQVISWLAPAVGLLVWWRTSAESRGLGTLVVMILAAIAGAAGFAWIAAVWLDAYAA